MAVEIRSISPDETDDLVRTIFVGFGQQLAEADLRMEREVLEPDRMLAAVEGDAFVGGTAPVSFLLTVPGAVVPAAGITSVAVLPTHRRRGILTAMVRHLLDELRDREPVSVLWSSEGSIYGRFGYGMATAAGEFTIQRHQTAFRQGYTPAGTVRLVSAEDALKALPAVYEGVRQGRPGFLTRSEAWWRRGFTVPSYARDDFGEHFFAVHETGGDADGYVAYRVKNPWQEPEAALRVEELVAASPEAYADLWRYVFDVDLVRRVTAEARPVDEPLAHLLADPFHLRLTLSDGMWVRPVRVPEALAARRYGTDGRLVLRVRDAFCPWNEGTYEVVGGPDGAECRRTDSDPDVSLGAEDLGAVYLGGVSLRSLAWTGRVAEERAGALALADAMFRWDPPPWCPFVF